MIKFGQCFHCCCPTSCLKFLLSQTVASTSFLWHSSSKDLSSGSCVAMPAKVAQCCWWFGCSNSGCALCSFLTLLHQVTWSDSDHLVGGHLNLRVSQKSAQRKQNESSSDLMSTKVALFSVHFNWPFMIFDDVMCSHHICVTGGCDVKNVMSKMHALLSGKSLHLEELWRMFRVLAVPPRLVQGFRYHW